MRQSQRSEHCRHDLEIDLRVLTLTSALSPNLILQGLQLRFLFLFMLLMFVLTDANEATYSIESGSNFSL